MVIKNKIQDLVQKTGLTNLKTRLIATYVLNIFDLFATSVFINWFGLEIEANPLAKVLFSNNTIYVVKTIMVAFGLFLLYKLVPKHNKYNWVTWAIFIVYLVLALYHCYLFANLLVIFAPTITLTVF